MDNEPNLELTLNSIVAKIPRPTQVLHFDYYLWLIDELASLAERATRKLDNWEKEE